MDESINDDLEKIPYKNEHGLSKEEQIWLSEKFILLNKGMLAEVALLEKINKKLTFFVVLVVIGLVLGFLSILRACIGL